MAKLYASIRVEPWFMDLLETVSEALQNETEASFWATYHDGSRMGVRVTTGEDTPRG